VVEFKQALLKEKDRFIRGFAEHLLSFALGREITPADSPSLDELVARTIADDYRIRTLIEGVVQSAPFVSRSKEISRKTSSSLESKPAIVDKQ